MQRKLDSEVNIAQKIICHFRYVVDSYAQDDGLYPWGFDGGIKELLLKCGKDATSLLEDA